MPSQFFSTKALIFAVAGIVVAAGAYFFVTKSGDIQESARAATATATTINKILSVTPKGVLTPAEIKESKEVSEGDKLSTSKDGRGIVEMEDGSTAVLDYSSEMIISSLGASRTSIALKTGSVWAQVKKVLGQGEFFEIKTQNAVAVVRGTSFGLTSHADGSSTLFVNEGTVRFAPVDPKTGAADFVKAKDVPAGDKAMLSNENVFTETPMTPAERNNEWVIFNTGKAEEDATDGIVPTVKTTAETEAAPVTDAATPATATTVTNAAEGVNSGETAPPARPANACGAFSETGGYAADSSGSLKLASIAPASVSQSGGGAITLTGTGFVCATTVAIGGKVFDGESGFTVVDNSTIILPASELPIGVFNVVMADALGNAAGLPRALTVTR